MKRKRVRWIGLVFFFIPLLVSVIAKSPPVLMAAPGTIAAQVLPEVAPSAQSSVTVSGTYEDPLGLFQVAILENYSVSLASGSPVFHNGNGSLAYSVVRVPLPSASPISEIGLVEAARRTFEKGEGFQTQTFNSIPGNGTRINWTGRFSQGTAPPRPLSGTILASQRDAAVYLLMVAAFEDSASQVPEVLSILADTMTIP